MVGRKKKESYTTVQTFPNSADINICMKHAIPRITLQQLFEMRTMCREAKKIVLCGAILTNEKVGKFLYVQTEMCAGPRPHSMSLSLPAHRCAIEATVPKFSLDTQHQHIWICKGGKLAEKHRLRQCTILDDRTANRDSRGGSFCSS